MHWQLGCAHLFASAMSELPQVNRNPKLGDCDSTFSVSRVRHFPWRVGAHIGAIGIPAWLMRSVAVVTSPPNVVGAAGPASWIGTSCTGRSARPVFVSAFSRLGFFKSSDCLAITLPLGSVHPSCPPTLTQPRLESGSSCGDLETMQSQTRRLCKFGICLALQVF